MVEAGVERTAKYGCSAVVGRLLKDQRTGVGGEHFLWPCPFAAVLFGECVGRL